jgi:cell wall-associated NlpC family hydrolase
MAATRTRSATREVVDIRKADRDASAYAGFKDDLDLESLKFHWLSDVTPDIEARGLITAISIERTIDGSSTVEITARDPDNRLFAGSRMWQPKPPKGKAAKNAIEYDYRGNAVVRPSKRGQAMEIAFDGIVFRLVKITKSGDDITLTFEDRTIYWLRRKVGARRAPRDKVTRAQFILSLLREIKEDQIRFVCPELNVRQPIDSTSSRKVNTKSKASRKSSGRGLSGSGLTVQGRAATAEQKRIGERALAVADAEGAGPKATLALIEACIVESAIRNIPFGDSSSVGVLQLLNIHGSVQRRLDVEWVVKQFLTVGFTGRGGAISIAKRNPSMTAGQVAQAVQGSNFPTRYDQAANEARPWVDAYGGSGGSVPESDAAGSGTAYRSYQFAREADEDSWTAIQRLASEVGWRCFLMGRSVFYMSEQDLYRRDPQYTITPDDPAILAVDFDVDWGKPVSEATVSVVAGRWKCPPGEPVVMTGFGPPDGRWLCVGWRRDYFSPVADITLRQPGRENLEPQAEQAGQSATDGSVVTDSGVDDSSAVGKAYKRADAIDRKSQSYSWGGGHGSFNDPGGYDCSGFVSSCLHAAGFLTTPMATGGLVNWGQSGQGKHMTVWVKENGDPHQSHTFIVFNLKGTDRYAEAGGSNSGHTGWHSQRSTAGFVPRHWPGT